MSECWTAFVATVCDMGTNSVKAMKLLGSTRREPFFQFQNQATPTIYDPPHLLKCTRNLFLKYDVDSQLPVNAKWEHIEKLHKQTFRDPTNALNCIKL